MEKKKILFIAYLYPPAGGKALPGVQRSVKFIRYMERFEKFVLTLREDLYPDFFTKDNKTILPVHQEKIVRTCTVDLFSILLKVRDRGALFLEKNDSRTQAPLSYAEIQTGENHKKSLFSKIKDFISGFLTFPDYAYGWIFPALWHGQKLIKRENIDIVFATGMPWSSLIVAWGLKILTGVKLVVDFRDPWVDNPFAHNKSGIRKKVEKYVERQIVRKSDMILLNTIELCKNFIFRYPDISENRFITLPNGYDESDFRNISPENRKENTDQLILCHTGFLYGLRDPKPIFEAIACIKEGNKHFSDKIVFKQIGYTNLNYNPEKYAEKRFLQKNYLNIGHLPYNECLQHMLHSDILVIIQQDTKTQIPSKLYEYIYLNKPIFTIASKNSALGNLIQKYHFGDIFETNDIDGITNYLIQKMSEKKKNGKLKADYEYRHKFDIKYIANDLEKIIEKIGEDYETV